MPHLYEVHAKNQIKAPVLIYSVYFSMVTVCVANVNEDGWFLLSDTCLEVRVSAL